MFEVLAIVGGKVHTLVPGAPALEAVIVVDGDRIREIGPNVRAPADARVVDARGLHVIPGLIDGFAYHDPAHDLLYTRAGVALVRDHGNELGRIFASRERADRDERLGPLLSIAGGVIDGVPPATNAAILVRTAEETSEAFTHLYEQKIDFSSFHASLTPECFRALCRAAAEKGLAVWGPRLNAVPLESALESGQRGFVFLDALLPAGRTWSEASVAEFEPNAKRLISAGGALVPMLRGYARMLEDQGDAAPELAWVGSQYESMWRAELALRREQLPQAQRGAAGAMLGKQRAVLRTLHELGVALVPGSGAPHPWLVPGEALVRELIEWQNVGIPPAACLEYATRGAAKTLGLAETRGTLEAGKLADLVLLRRDPTTDLNHLFDVEGIVLRGKLLERATLETKANELRAALATEKAVAQAPLEVPALALPEGSVLLSGRVETVGSTGRIAAERFAVVRELDETVTLCGVRRILASAGNAEALVEVRQRTKKDALTSFEVKVRNSGHEFVARGSQVGGQWRVERRFDGAFVDIQAARESIVAIDCDSVTTYLLLGHTRSPGQFPIVRMEEGLQLEVVRWDLALDDDGDHTFKTPGGLKLVGFEEYGAIQAVVEQVGSGGVQTTLMEVDLHGGPGYPLPAGKLELKRRKQPESRDGK